MVVHASDFTTVAHGNGSLRTRLWTPPRPKARLGLLNLEAIILATCRPPVPTDAERARGIAVRGGEASLVGTGTPPVSPIVHHVWADGSAAVLLDEDDALLARVGDDGSAAMLEIADRAPVDLREPVHGLLWITGVLTRPADARRLAAAVAEVRPDPRLLDLGHGELGVALEALTGRPARPRRHADT